MKRLILFFLIISFMVMIVSSGVQAQVPGTSVSKCFKVKLGKYFLFGGKSANMFGGEFGWRFNMPLIAVNVGIEGNYGTVSDRLSFDMPGEPSIDEKLIFIKGVGTLYMPKLLGGLGIFSPYVGVGFGYFINNLNFSDTNESESLKGTGGIIKFGLDFNILNFGAYLEFERIMKELDSENGSVKLSANILWLGVRF